MCGDMHHGIFAQVSVPLPDQCKCAFHILSSIFKTDMIHKGSTCLEFAIKSSIPFYSFTFNLINDLTIAVINSYGCAQHRIKKGNPPFIVLTIIVRSKSSWNKNSSYYFYYHLIFILTTK